MFKDNKPSKILFITGGSIIFFNFILLTLATLFLIFRLPIFSWTLLLGIVLTSIFTALSSRLYFGRNFLPPFFLAISLLVASFAVSYFISLQFYDLSYDGQAYHADLIYNLKTDWHPHYETLSKAETSNQNRWWENNYTIGSETIATTLYAYTNTFESTKTFNFLWMFTLFYISLSVLLTFKGLSGTTSTTFALLATFNPITLGEAISLYIDGQLFAILIINIFLFVACYFSRKNYPFILLFFLTAVGVNLKLTAPVYLLIFNTLFAITIFLTERLESVKKYLLSLVAGLLFGLIILGFHPYVTNFINHGSPLYPAAGRGAFDLKRENVPENYFDKSSVEILFLSAFSESDNKRGVNNFSRLKLPFTVTDTDLKTFSYTSAIVGGWGPLFSGALILAFIALSVAILDKKFSFRKALLLISGVILASCVINPMSSVARYAPQFWLVPYLSTLILFLQSKWYYRLFGATILLILLVNSYLIGKSNLNYNLETTQLWKNDLAKLQEISKQSKTPLTVDFKAYQNKWRALFAEKNIAYIEKPEETCPNPKRILKENIISMC